MLRSTRALTLAGVASVAIGFMMLMRLTQTASAQWVPPTGCPTTVQEAQARLGPFGRGDNTKYWRHLGVDLMYGFEVSAPALSFKVPRFMVVYIPDVNEQYIQYQRIPPTSKFVLSCVGTERVDAHIPDPTTSCPTTAAEANARFPGYGGTWSKTYPTGGKYPTFHFGGLFITMMVPADGLVSVTNTGILYLAGDVFSAGDLYLACYTHVSVPPTPTATPCARGRCLVTTPTQTSVPTCTGRFCNIKPTQTATVTVTPSIRR